MRRTARGAVALLLLTACGGGRGAPAADPPPAPCPQALAVPEGEPPPVPQPPTADTGGRLVPQRPPDSALLCRYRPVGVDPRSSPGPAALTGHRQLTGLATVADDLFLPRRLPGQARRCPPTGSARTPYLLRLSYPDGVVWVSAVQEASSCADAGNGEFVTQQDLGRRFAASYQQGTWTVPEPSSRTAPACGTPAAGRAGQEGSLVPGEPERLEVCTGTSRRELAPEVLRQVRDVLDEPSAQPAGGGCAKERPGATHLLVFRYASGPPVRVRFTVGCAPTIDNGSLQAQLTPELERRLDALLR